MPQVARLTADFPRGYVRSANAKLSARLDVALFGVKQIDREAPHVARVRSHLVNPQLLRLTIEKSRVIAPLGCIFVATWIYYLDFASRRIGPQRLNLARLHRFFAGRVADIAQE